MDINSQIPDSSTTLLQIYSLMQMKDGNNKS
jgi:hypothetical protein